MKHLISSSIFLVIAIIAWWSVTEDFSDSDKSQLAKSQRYVEVFMNEFELTAMNDSGALNYRLNGSHLQQFNDSDEAEIKLPVFHLLEQNAQWKISADNATLNNKKDTIQLNSNVVMQQQNSEPALTIRTQNLLIQTKTQIAQTQALVDISQGKSQMKSNGMVFNNLTSELELSSNVSGYYLP